jgi:hypothetical protein
MGPFAWIRPTSSHGGPHPTTTTATIASVPRFWRLLAVHAKDIKRHPQEEDTNHNKRERRRHIFRRTKKEEKKGGEEVHSSDDSTTSTTQADAISIIMSAQPTSDEEAVAAADKEMEERANRAKELLSKRYVGLKSQQVSVLLLLLMLLSLSPLLSPHFRFSLFSLYTIPYYGRRPAKPAKCNWNVK